MARIPVLADDFRPSLEILLSGAGINTPSTQTFVARKQATIQSLMERMRQASTPKVPSVSMSGAGSPARGGSEFERLVNAIGGKESGGNYRAVNRSSGALGKYQIMPGNIRSWSQQILGRSISPATFLSNPNLQETIARGMLLNYYKKYGAAGAATAWYAGPGAVRSKMGSTKKQGAYPSISAYWNDILRRMR